MTTHVPTCIGAVGPQGRILCCSLHDWLWNCYDVLQLPRCRLWPRWPLLEGLRCASCVCMRMYILIYISIYTHICMTDWTNATHIAALGAYRFWRDMGYAIGALVTGAVADWVQHIWYSVYMTYDIWYDMMNDIYNMCKWRNEVCVLYSQCIGYIYTLYYICILWYTHLLCAVGALVTGAVGVCVCVYV